MDTTILTDATLLFRQASLGWADVMSPFLLKFLYELAMVELALLFIVHFFRIEIGPVFGIMVHFFLATGFTIFMVKYGWQAVDSWFNGVKHLAYFMGSPTADPSAIAGWGWVVADPITKSLARQGFLSYATNPATWIFGLGATLALLFAFALLALMEMGLLLLSYFLTAACPWFMVFCALSFTRPITMGYVRLVFGNMNGLFCVLLMVAIVNELGALLEMEMRTKFLNPAVTLTWADYAGAMVVGIALCVVFVSMPLVVMRSMDGIAMNWAGSRMASGMGYAAVNSVIQMVSSSGGSGGSGGGGGGAPQQLPSPQQPAPQQQTQRSGAWGRRS